MSTDPNDHRFMWPSHDELATPDAIIELTYKAPISTRLLSNAQVAYQEWSDTDARLRADIKMRDWFKGPECAELEREVREGVITGDAFSTRCLREHVTRKLVSLRSRPESIPDSSLPSVLRAGRAAQLAERWLPEAQRDRLMAATLGSPDVTIGSLAQHYATSDWIEDALTDSDLGVIFSQRRLLVTDPYELRFRTEEHVRRHERRIAALAAKLEAEAA